MQRYLPSDSDAKKKSYLQIKHEARVALKSKDSIGRRHIIITYQTKCYVWNQISPALVKDIFFLKRNCLLVISFVLVQLLLEDKERLCIDSVLVVNKSKFHINSNFKSKQFCEIAK